MSYNLPMVMDPMVMDPMVMDPMAMDAVRRAEYLDSAECDYGRDPSSGVWPLARLITRGGQIR